MTIDKYDIFAFAGQSNSAGHFGSYDGNTALPQGNEVFAAGIEAATGFSTEVINAATGGSGSNELSNPNSYWWNLTNNQPGPLLLEAVANIQSNMDAGQDLDGIIWGQGEADAFSIAFSSNPDVYLAHLVEATTQIFQYFQAIFGEDVPVFIQEMGDYPNPNPTAMSVNSFDLVRDAQFALTESMENVFMGADTTGLAYLSDNIHFSTESYNAIAAELAETAVSVISQTTTDASVVSGTSAADTFVGEAGDQRFDLLAGDDLVILNDTGRNNVDGGAGQDQVVYEGRSTDYTITRNADGNLSVLKADGTIDVLTSIESFWFNGDQQWFSADSFGAETPDSEGLSGTAEDDFLTDTVGDTAVNALGGNDNVLVNATGNNNIDGGEGNDQVIYEGNSTDYTITVNTDGTLSVAKPSGDVDVLTSVESFWFNGDQQWFSAESFGPSVQNTDDLTGSSGDDFLLDAAGDTQINSLGGDDNIVVNVTGNNVIDGGDRTIMTTL